MTISTIDLRNTFKEAAYPSGTPAAERGTFARVAAGALKYQMAQAQMQSLYIPILMSTPSHLGKDSAPRLYGKSA